jgi:hypothetical protein
MKGMGMLSNVKQRFNQWREERRQKAHVRKLTRAWERLSSAQKEKAQAAAIAKAHHELEMLRRMQLMDAARRALLAGDRVRALSGGVLWWPALAPLKPVERDVVRRDLGLQTRPTHEERAS